jgi:hypothetical protein
VYGGGGESTYTAQFTELELRLENWQLEIRGRAVFSRKLSSEWRRKRFETYRIDLVSGNGSLTKRHRDQVRNLCLNAGFLPDGALFEYVFKAVEDELLEISRDLRTQLHSHPSVVKAA